jgi:hypothetical protein
MRASTTSRIAIAAALMAATVAACGGDDADDSPDPTPATSSPTTSGAPDTTASPSTTAAPPTSTTSSPLPTTSAPPDTGGVGDIAWNYSDPATHPIVTVLDAGAEPRAVRMWTPAAGATFTLTTVTTTAIDQTIGGLNQTLEQTLEIPATIEILAITDEGWIASTTYGDPSIEIEDPAVRAAVEQEIAGIAGLTVHQITAPDGTIVATSGVDGLPGAEFAPTSLSGVAAPLPSEPIGPGAVWEVRGSLESAGFVFEQTTTLTLVDVIDAQLTIDVVIDQALDPESPGLVGIDSFIFESDNSGQGVWDLSRGFPVSASSQGTQTLELSVTVGEDTETLFQATTVSLELRTASVD